MMLCVDLISFVFVLIEMRNCLPMIGAWISFLVFLLIVEGESIFVPACLSVALHIMLLCFELDLR